MDGMRRAATLLAFLLAPGFTSCLADFDRTLWDFTEGPVQFHLDASGMEVPEALMDDSTGHCVIAEVACADEACDLDTALCNLDDVCQPRVQALLSQVVDMSDAYAPEQTRVESVALTDLSAVLVASSIDFPIEDVRIRWAPQEAPQAEATDVAVLGPVEPGGSNRALELTLMGEGVRSLESHLVHYEGFRIFIDFTTSLDPGDSCPEGALDLELSFRFLMTGEPRV